MKRKIFVRILCVLMMVTMLLPLAGVSTFADGGVSINIYPGARPVKELIEDLSKNDEGELFGAGWANYYGDDQWNGQYSSQYYVVDRVIEGRPKPGADRIDLERISLAYSTKAMHIYDPNRSTRDGDFFCEDPTAPAEDVGTTFGTIELKINMTYALQRYEDETKFINDLKHEGAEAITFNGQSGYLIYDLHYDDLNPENRPEPYSGNGTSAWTYYFPLISTDDNTFGVALRVFATVFCSFPGHVVFSDGPDSGVQMRSRDIQAAAAKELWDSSVKPAFDEGLQKAIQSADLRFERKQLYTGEFVFGGEPEEKEEEEGYWQLQKIDFYGEMDHKELDPPHTSDRGTYAYTRKLYAGGCRDEVSHHEFVYYDGTVVEAANTEVTFTNTEPNERYSPGDVASIYVEIDAVGEDANAGVHMYTSFQWNENYDGRYGAAITQAAEGNPDYHIISRTEDSSSYTAIYTGADTAEWEIPKGGADGIGDEMIIAIHYGTASQYSGDMEFAYAAYRYKWVGDGAAAVGPIDIEIDTPAKEEAGEDGGTTIPSIIILGTLGAGAAAAAAATGEGEGDDKKKRSTFKMYINKNFGNSLKKGDKPQAVFARIVEVKPSGEEIDRIDLTRQIQVFSSDNSLTVTDGGMSNNGYRCAMASVPDVDQPEPEGKVSFFFEGEGGTFTQNVIFNIAVPGIKFFQDNLTLPAGILEEPEFLPFEVSEMGDKYTIDLSYSGEDYELDITDCDDKDAQDIHFAVFMEKNKEILDAGVYTEGWLTVTVKNEAQTLKASIKIIRMGMGLCLPVKALNCYRVPKKESAGKEMKDMKPMDFETSITETSAYILYYDEESHEVRQMAAFPNVTFAPFEGETDEKKKQIQNALDHIKITPKLLKVDGDFANYAFVCEGGFLDAPTRYFVKMSYSADVTIGSDEKAKQMHYEAAREVLLRSQPCRLVAGVRDNYEVDQYDDQIREMLFGIQEVIFENFLDQAFPIYNMIERMTAGYDRAYGFEPYQVAKVVDAWQRFQSGELKGIGSDVNTYGVADELEALAAATRSWDGWSGIVLRISLDVMTGGASEIVMVALDVNRAAMDYHKQTGGNGTAFGYFKAMAIPLALGSLGAVAAAGKGAARWAGGAARKLAPVKTAALMEKAAKIKGVAKEMASLAAADAKHAAGYVASKIPQGAKNASTKIGKAINEFVENVDKFDPKLTIAKSQKATSVVSTAVNKGKSAGDAVIAEAKAATKTLQEKCLDAAGSATAKEGELVYNELIAAKKALQSNPTSGAAQIRYNQAMMEFKASHAAIEHANAVLPGEQLAMRKVINEDLENTIAKKVEDKFRTKIADKYNIDPTTVRFDRATGNTDLSTKIGRDLDWTPKVVTKEGGTKYVSQVTADELLEQAVRETVEERCGKEFAAKFAENGKFARKLDHTACTVQNKDFFTGGLDTVKQVTDKTRMGEFMGADKARSVADTLRYKGAHPYAEGARLEKEVLSGLSDSQVNALSKELEAYAKADTAAAKTMQLSENAKKLKEAYALMEEGMYQPSKYGKKVVDKEWVSLKNGYSETLSGQDYTSMRILDRGAGQALPGEMMTPGAEWVGDRITLSEARKACALNGTTLEGAIESVGNSFERIDAKFGYGTSSQIMGGFGIGGAINGLGGSKNT